MTQTLTTETLKLWRRNAEITTGETAEHDPEHIAAKAILALTVELLANREAQPLGYIDPANLKTYRGVMAGGSWSPVERTLSGLNLTLPIYLAAPPAPAVPEEMTKEDAMGFVRERPPFKGSVECVQTTWNACRAAMLAQPVSQGCKLVPIEPTKAMRDAWFFMEDFDTEWKAMLAAAPDEIDKFADQVIGTKTKIIRMPAPLNVPQEGIRVYLNADELFIHLEKQGYIVEVSNE